MTFQNIGILLVTKHCLLDYTIKQFDSVAYFEYAAKVDNCFCDLDRHYPMHYVHGCMHFDLTV